MSKEDDVRQKLVNIYLKYYGEQSTPMQYKSSENQSEVLTITDTPQSNTSSNTSYESNCSNPDTYKSDNQNLQELVDQPIEDEDLPDSLSEKPHIVINKYKTYYALLDANFNLIDSISIDPISSFILKFSHRFEFKRMLRTDLAAYKKACKARHIKPSKKIKQMHKEMLYNLKLCPDADFYILQLLRRNITKLNPEFSNYQTACALYLQELSMLHDGDPDQLPFDINFATSDNRIYIDHKYISNTFISNSKDVITDFRKAYQIPISKRDKFLKEHRFTIPKVPEKFKQAYSYERSVKMKRSTTEDRDL